VWTAAGTASPATPVATTAALAAALLGRLRALARDRHGFWTVPPVVIIHLDLLLDELLDVL